MSRQRRALAGRHDLREDSERAKAMWENDGTVNWHRLAEVLSFRTARTGDGQPQVFVSSELRDLVPVDVNFGGCLQLTGVRMSREAAGLELRLRWRGLRRHRRRWVCFAHVVANERQVSSFDHEILGGRPSSGQWDEGDEGYEARRLWAAGLPEDVQVRLGVYDPEINVRAPVLASTLPVADEGSAVWISSRTAAAGDYVSFEAAPLEPCHVQFEGGEAFAGRVELTAWSAVWQQGLLWLRLKWILRRDPATQRDSRPVALRFFGHVVDQPAREAPTLVQFDESLARENRGPATAVEQNIVRAAPQEPHAGSPLWLRAGLCTAVELHRLRILSGAAEFDPDDRCTYLKILGKK